MAWLCSKLTVHCPLCVNHWALDSQELMSWIVLVARRNLAWYTKKHFLDLKRVLFTSWKLAMFTNKQNIEFTIPAMLDFDKSYIENPL